MTTSLIAATAVFTPYDSSNSEVELQQRSGQLVTIVREFPVDEGRRMYSVRFADGFESDVFPDELTDTAQAGLTMVKRADLDVLFDAAVSWRDELNDHVIPGANDVNDAAIYRASSTMIDDAIVRIAKVLRS